MNTRMSMKEIDVLNNRKRNIEEVLENFTPKARKTILLMRERYACLMELPKERITKLQRVALYRNYQYGESKILCFTSPVTNKDCSPFVLKYINE